MEMLSLCAQGGAKGLWHKVKALYPIAAAIKDFKDLIAEYPRKIVRNCIKFVTGIASAAVGAALPYAISPSFGTWLEGIPSIIIDSPYFAKPATVIISVLIIASGGNYMVKIIFQLYHKCKYGISNAEMVLDDLVVSTAVTRYTQRHPHNILDIFTLKNSFNENLRSILQEIQEAKHHEKRQESAELRAAERTAKNPVYSKAYFKDIWRDLKEGSTELYNEYLKDKGLREEAKLATPAAILERLNSARNILQRNASMITVISENAPPLLSEYGTPLVDLEDSDVRYMPMHNILPSQRDLQSEPVPVLQAFNHRLPRSPREHKYPNTTQVTTERTLESMSASQQLEAIQEANKNLLGQQKFVQLTDSLRRSQTMIDTREVPHTGTNTSSFSP